MNRKLASYTLVVVGAVSLLTCLSSAIAVFWGLLHVDVFKAIFLWASIVWFVAAGAWALRGKAPSGVE